MKSSNYPAVPDVLNLTPPQVDRTIILFEGEVTRLSVAIQERIEPCKEAEQMYRMLKDELDGLQSQLDDYKSGLGELGRYRNNQHGGKENRTMRATSHTDQKKTARVKEFKWQDMAIDSLKKVNRFVYPDELYAIIQQQYAEQFKGKDKLRMQREVKPRVVANWRKSAAIKEGKRIRKQPVFILYKDKLGLVEWVDDEKRPMGKYIKDFMHAEKASA